MFLVAFAHGIYVIRTKNWRFSKTLIAYLLPAEAATIILASGILVGVYNSKKNEATVGCPRLFLSLMSSLKPVIIITYRFFIDTHWAGGIIKIGSSNMATDLIRQIVVAVLRLAIAHSSYQFVRRQLPALNFPKLPILMPKQISSNMNCILA